MDLFHQFVQIFILWHCCWQCQAVKIFNSCFANYRQRRLIESSMNLKVEPCDNFYDYACGNWDKTYEGAKTNFVEAVTMLDYNANEEMHRVLDELIIENKPKFIQKVHKYYKSCTNLQKLYTKPYITWLEVHDQFKWPSRGCNHQLDWVETLAKMRIYGFNEVFIQLTFVKNQIIVIELNKPDDFVPLIRQSYDLILETLIVKNDPEVIKRGWQIIEQFEESLAALNAKQFENKSVIKFKDMPLEWLKKYLRIVLNQTVINPDMELFVQNKSYMLALDKLLPKLDEHFLNFYLVIRFLRYLHSNAPYDISEVACLSSTRRLMPTAMNWLYEHFHPELRTEFPTIYQIFNKVRREFAETIQRNKHGFDLPLVNHLYSKLHRMYLKINNIPRGHTVYTLEKFYQDLDLNENDFFGNHLKLLRFNFKAHQSLLDKSKTVLDIAYLESANMATSSSPYYREDLNTIFVPLTLLQQPLYNKHLDDVYKYSSLGFLIAHEMFHGFDDRGLLRDANGNEMLINFKENNLFNASFNCLLESNPKIINEKIADISGLHYAYRTYFETHPEALNRTLRVHDKEMPLTQVFFLNFAQFFCGSLTSEQMQSSIEHGSDRERVMHALAHFPEFANAYQCSRSRRSLLKTCHLWR